MNFNQRNFIIGVCLCLVMNLMCIRVCDSMDMHENGYWCGEDAVEHHFFDHALAQALVKFFKAEKATSIVDFGCGTGEYVKTLLDNNFKCIGYDGNPDTVTLTKGIAQVADLSSPLDLKERFDWVLSLEVAEHLPKQFEKVFVENLHRHNTKGIVVSWAFKGQGGVGHFNEKNNSDVKEIMARLGYVNDVNAENELREQAAAGWFKTTIMVFRKTL